MTVTAQLKYVQERFNKFLQRQLLDNQRRSRKEEERELANANANANANARVRVLPVLLRAFAPELASAAALNALSSCLLFTAPQILRRLIRVLSKEDYAWKGKTWPLFCQYLPN